MQHNRQTNGQGLGARQRRAAEMPRPCKIPCSAAVSACEKGLPCSFENTRLQGWMAERASQLLEELQLQELLLDVINYAVAISACMKSRMAEKVLHLSEEISKDPTRMDNLRSSDQCARAHWQRGPCGSLWLRLEGLQPNVITDTTVISSGEKGWWRREPCSSYRRCYRKAGWQSGPRCSMRRYECKDSRPIRSPAQWWSLL